MTNLNVFQPPFFFLEYFFRDSVTRSCDGIYTLEFAVRCSLSLSPLILPRLCCVPTQHDRGQNRGLFTVLGWTGDAMTK